MMFLHVQEILDNYERETNIPKEMAIVKPCNTVAEAKLSLSSVIVFGGVFGGAVLGSSSSGVNTIVVEGFSLLDSGSPASHSVQ